LNISRSAVFGTLLEGRTALARICEAGYRDNC
jgi:hypothetical protein